MAKLDVLDVVRHGAEPFASAITFSPGTNRNSAY